MVHPGTLFHRRQRGIPMHSYENRSEIRALVEVRQRDAVALPPLPQHVFPQVATRHELRRAARWEDLSATPQYCASVLPVLRPSTAPQYCAPVLRPSTAPQ